jgi:hypothetical protein
MTEEGVERLIGVLAAQEPKRADRRKYERLQYRKIAILVLIDRPGGDTSFVVLTENISFGGIAFKHQSRLEPDTPCRIKIMLLSGGSVECDGKIVHCRDLEGRGYEIGLQFDRVLGVSLASFRPKLDFKDHRADGPSDGSNRRCPAMSGDTSTENNVNP